MILSPNLSRFSSRQTFEGLRGYCNKKHSFWSPERIVGNPTMNKWNMVPPAVLTHLCIGSIYSWSVINEPLMHEVGVVASASSDWTLPMVLPIVSVVLGLHGLSAAFLGRWQDRVGPRVSGVVGALCYGGGMALGGLGVALHNLPLVYLGAGVLAGLGLGFAYVPPIAMLVKWFPQNRGLATGTVVMGFGGGALVTTPIQTLLLKHFSRAPTYLGSDQEVNVILQDGKRFVEIAGELKEVVYASAQDLIQSPGLSEGFYLASTGSTGAAMTLMCMGMGFFSVMMTSALMYRTYPIQPVVKAVDASSPTPDTHFNVHYDTVIRTPQFWKLWFIFAGLSSSGLATISVSKTMIKEIFVHHYPLIVTGAFTSACVMVFSVANLFGRLYWSSLSDRVGRKKIMSLFTLASVPLYLAIPATISCLPYTHSVLPLVVFVSTSFIIFSFFGGIYSVTPAYETDLFGPKYFGTTHGRMLTASAFGALSGPIVLAKLREMSEIAAIKDLSIRLDPSVFLEHFGAPISQLDTLISTKVVTIHSLLHLLPDAIDPTPFLYNTTMYAAASVVSLTVIAALTINPVDPRFHEKLPSLPTPPIIKAEKKTLE